MYLVSYERKYKRLKAIIQIQMLSKVTTLEKMGFIKSIKPQSKIKIYLVIYKECEFTPKSSSVHSKKFSGL